MPATQAKPLRRLLRHARAYRRRITIATTASILNKAVDIAPPLLIGIAVDVVVERQDSLIASFGVEDVVSQLWVLAALTVAIWTLESIFEYILRVQWRNLAQSLQHELRMDAYRHVQSLEMAYFEEQSTGEMMAILNDDVNQLERFLDEGANDLLQVGTTVVLIGVIYFYLAPSVAWLAFAPIPVILWGSFKFQRRIAPRYAEVRSRAGMLNSQLANNLGGIATIKSFTAEEREADRIAAGSNEYRSANRLAIRLSSAFSPLIRMAVVSGFTAMLVWGGYLVDNGSLAVGSYTVMIFLTQRLLWPLTRLGQTVDLYHRAMASTTRILDLLDTEIAVLDGVAELSPEQAEGAINFHEVDFRYHADVPVLSGITFEIEPGVTTAIVGSTGSGKTTIIKLLLRFYDLTGGKITIGGMDLRDLRLAGLRHAIGLVSQDVFLFHGTVRENIEYGRPGASLEDVVVAARIAEADEFVLSLPEGYETIVGERGQKLSGGQRQRLSIARAVLKDPAVLILDEATSSVDNETEAAIQRSLERISVGRTTVVIAHRLSTVRNAERIFVMDGGKIAEHGTHEELIAANGGYASLWRVQTGLAVEHHPPRAEQ